MLGIELCRIGERVGIMNWSYIVFDTIVTSAEIKISVKVSPWFLLFPRPSHPSRFFTLSRPLGYISYSQLAKQPVFLDLKRPRLSKQPPRRPPQMHPTYPQPKHHFLRYRTPFPAAQKPRQRRIHMQPQQPSADEPEDRVNGLDDAEGDVLRDEKPEGGFSVGVTGRGGGAAHGVQV